MIHSQDNRQSRPSPGVKYLPFSQRALYRVWQFQLALRTRPDQEQIERARAYLSSAEFGLFARMQPSEQVHSLQVLDRLIEQSQKNVDLLAAALLHDVGKSLRPLAIWERVMIVLGKAFFPAKAIAWGKRGTKNAFVVATQHAQWGAELAEQAGCTPLTVYLIRHHQDHLPAITEIAENRLLSLLQAADEAL